MLLCAPVSPGTCSMRPEPEWTEAEGGRHIHWSRVSRLGLAKCSSRMLLVLLAEAGWA